MRSRSVLRPWRWLLSAAALLACDKQGPAPAQPEQAAAPPVAAAAPADDDAAGESDEPEPESLDDESEPEPSSAAEELSAEAAYASADATASEAMGGAYLLTPALPLQWPPVEPRVMYFVYPLDPVKGGAVEDYTCRAAALRITLDLASRETQVEKLAAGKKLGSIERGRGRSAADPIHGAETALFAVARGEKTAEKSKYLLARYSAWMDKNPVLAKDVRKRAAAFFAFVEGTR